MNLIVTIILLSIQYSSYEQRRTYSKNRKIRNYVNRLLRQRKYDLSYYTNLPSNMHSVLTNTSQKGMVVSDDVRCSRVGAYQLEHGGNAIDAAIATNLCLSVIELQSTGLAGGGFALSLFNGKLSALDFREKSPIRMATHDLKPTKSGPKSFGIPGTPLGLHKLWKKGGNLKWSSLFELPIIIAYKGWALKQHCYISAKLHRKKLYRDPLLRRMFFKHKKLKRPGSRLRNIQLAKSLYILSRNYRAMNTGRLARAMARALREKRAPHRLRDFRNYRVKRLKFLIYKFDKSKYLITTSERSGGALIVYIIKSIKKFLRKVPISYKSAQFENAYYKNLIRVIKHSIRDTSKLVGDSRLRFLERTAKKWPSRRYSQRKPKTYDIRGTSSLNVIDKDGNGVSITSTINHQFGAKFSFRGTGIIANNDLADYNRYKPKSPKANVKRNNPYDHSRPLSSMAPTMIIDRKSKRLVGLFGGTGGKKIPAAIAQVIINHYIKKLTLPTSVSHFRLFHPYRPNIVYSEAANPIPKKIKNYLKRNNLRIKKLIEAHSSGITAISIIRDRRSKSITVIGAADFRKEGGATGL